MADHQRESFLRQQCGDDAALLDDVRSLLAAAQRDPLFLEWQVPEAAVSADRDRGEQREAALVGREFGNYRITRFIAAGGMGAVYEAQQKHPPRAVALKIMRSFGAGPAAAESQRRFEREVEALGRMRHPAVAHIHDAGTIHDESGSFQYLAMEFIPEARTIIDFAIERALSTADRLALLARVCDAVHHGHQRGVIHRDLKPGNILVDADGQPKVIDFGVARATEDSMKATLMTEPGLLIGTLQYMSPEQVADDDRDVDVRSDVYALGMVGYELLAGRPPYDVGHASIVRAVQTIRDTPPRRLATHQPELRGDVETIIHKAIEKDRERRYESAAALADDLRRWRAGEPIAARPATALHQVRLFARRNRALAIGLAVAVAGLLLGTAGAVWQAVSATQAERRAVHEAERAVESERAAVNESIRANQIARGLIRVIESLDIDKAGFLTEISPLAGGSGEVLNGFITVVEEQYRYEPETLANVLDRIGSVYKSEGAFDRARALFLRAKEVREQAFGPNDPRRAISLMILGDLALFEGDEAGGMRLYHEAHELLRVTLDEQNPDAIDGLSHLRSALMHTDNLREAERVAIEIDRIINATPEYPSRWENVAVRGQIARELGNYDEAVTLLRQALRLLVERAGMNDPNYGGVLYHLAVTAARKNDQPLLREVGALADELDRVAAGLPADHPHHTGQLLLRGVLAMALGDLDAAEPLLRDCADRRAAMWGRNQKLSAYARNVLGECLMRQGRLDEAEPMLMETAEIIRRTYGTHHAWSLEAAARVAQCRTARDQP